MFRRRDIPPVLLLLLLIILVMLTLSQILVVHNGRYGRGVHNIRKLQLELREMDINLHSLMLQNVPSIELNRRLLQNQINAERIAAIIRQASEPVPTRRMTRPEDHHSQPHIKQSLYYPGGRNPPKQDPDSLTDKDAMLPNKEKAVLHMTGSLNSNTTHIAQRTVQQAMQSHTEQLMQRSTNVTSVGEGAFREAKPSVIQLERTEPNSLLQYYSTEANSRNKMFTDSLYKQIHSNNVPTTPQVLLSSSALGNRKTVAGQLDEGLPDRSVILHTNEVLNDRLKTHTPEVPLRYCPSIPPNLREFFYKPKLLKIYQSCQSTGTFACKS